MADKRLALLTKELAKSNGILPLKPAWVARDFLPPGKRLGLPEDAYKAGKRGWISERWLASVTLADNAVGPPDEGLSYLNLEGKEKMTLKEAVDLAPGTIMGKTYAKTHKGLGRLAKIYDFNSRIPYHIHQMEKDAKLVGRNSKDEAYYFLENVPMGPHPETFFGVHPHIVKEKKFDILLPHLVEWKDDLILRHSRAYLNAAGEGFFLGSGLLHAPGTALTLELQEDSDVFAMLQALNAGKIISKDLLFKDVRKSDREKKGERVILDQLDWPGNGDPFFYENHHLSPILCSEQTGGKEYWIYYNTKKFSGKKMIVRPGKSMKTKEKGVYSILVWQGSGTFDGHKIKAGDFDRDELLVTYDKAVEELEVKNTGKKDLLLFKFFGPGINPDCPMIKPYKT
ncbi:MAG: hypothetical protein E4H36_00100 [Spirochaetales bacterium]|nr:MAG: hypothetical protein E4H36_00100 [Spirochaetales bacterium]